MEFVGHQRGGCHANDRSKTPVLKMNVQHSFAPLGCGKVDPDAPDGVQPGEWRIAYSDARRVVSFLRKELYVGTDFVLAGGECLKRGVKRRHGILCLCISCDKQEQSGRIPKRTAALVTFISILCEETCPALCGIKRPAFPIRFPVRSTSLAYVSILRSCTQLSNQALRCVPHICQIADRHHNRDSSGSCST